MDLQDKLTGTLIGLARATDGNEHLISDTSTAVILEGLAATRTGAESDDAALERLCARAVEEKRKMVPDCFTCASPCGKNNDYDMSKLWNGDEDVRSLKSLILFGIRGVAACACRAGYHEREVGEFLYKALIVIGIDDYGMDDLLSIALEVGKANLKCMAMDSGHDSNEMENGEVCSLLTGLYLGVRDIRLSSELTAFLSPKVLKLLAEKFSVIPGTR